MSHLYQITFTWDTKSLVSRLSQLLCMQMILACLIIIYIGDNIVIDSTFIPPGDYRVVIEALDTMNKIVQKEIPISIGIHNYT